MVDITDALDSGWQFDSWTGDVVDTGSVTTTVTVDSGKTLIVNFSRVKPSWWLIGGIIAGVIIIGGIIWLVVRSRTA